MSKDLSSEIADVLDKHGVADMHGGKLIGDLMGVAMDYEKQMKTQRIEDALKFITENGGIDGAHHKQWVLDQVVKRLAGDYEEWVKEYNAGEDGANTYEWDTGVTP